MPPDPQQQLLELRLQQMGDAAAEAIRREVAWLKRHNFPVWVASNGHVVDARENGSGEEAPVPALDS